MDDNAKDKETIDFISKVMDTNYQNQEATTTYSPVSQSQRRNWKTGTENKSCWLFLPVEIRLIILDLLAQENRGLALYASVCKEWQAVIEKKNFC
ncbi:hypothetical protein B0J14DRAFT_210285 [Halenospora varia]|nr:hypothetical protein B0J14DRAFT_210285 [Halenospora varia]